MTEQMMLLLFAFIFSFGGAAQFNNDAPSNVLRYDMNDRIRGFSGMEQSDVVLGGLVPVHDSLISGLCSQSVYRESIDYVEAILYSLDLINDDKELLPNTTLGYDIRDSCLSVDVAVEEVVDLILVKPSECTFSVNSANFTTRPTVSAVLGEQVSFVSIPVASFLSLAETPQISYLSTSVLLSDRSKYPFFYRTVPSDDQQAQVLIDIVVKFGWTLVSAIYSNDLYGRPGMDNFRELAAQYGICIEVDIGIEDFYTESDYQVLINELLDSSANVIVLFSSIRPSEELFNWMSKLSLSRKFFWLTSDAVTHSPLIFPKYADLLSGMLGVSLFTNSDDGFIEYFATLNQMNNRRNPWFAEYYEIFYNCSNHDGNDNCQEYYNNTIASSPTYSPDQNAPLLIDAVYLFAHALDAFVRENCDFPIMWNSTTHLCSGQKKELNGQNLQSYLNNVNFISPTGNHIVFKDSGGINGKYEISNYQLVGNENEHAFVTVAMWDSTRGQNRLDLEKNVTLQFGVNKADGASQVLASIRSECPMCPIGNIKIISDNSSCCGACSPCLGQEYSSSVDARNCSVCPEERWGNDPLNGSHACVEVGKIYASASHPAGILSILFICILIIANTCLSVFFGFKWNSEALKAMGRAMYIVMIIAVFVSSFSVIFYVVEPSTGVCLFQRVLGWICFSLLLSPLLVSQMGITWDFALKNEYMKKYVKKKFVDWFYQLVIVLVLVSFQLFLTIVSLLVVHPAADRDLLLNMNDINRYPSLRLACDPSHIALDILQIFYHTLMLVAFTVLALGMLVKGDSKNFKYSGPCAVVLSTVWMIFMIAYFAVDKDYRAFPFSLCLFFTAFVVLALFMLPMLLLQFDISSLSIKNKLEMKKKPEKKNSTIEYSIKSVGVNNAQKENSESKATTRL